MPFSLSRLPVEEVLDHLHEAGRYAIASKDEAINSAMYKTDNELVTSVDIQIQEKLIECLSPIFLNARIIAEESNQRDNNLNISLARKSEWTWIIDPIDGTTSYFSGLKTYGIQVALAHKGVLVAGWIHCPELEKSAAADINGINLRCGIGTSVSRKVDSLSEVWMVLASGDFDEAHKHKASLLAQQTANVRKTASCAVDYTDMLEGDRDLLVYKRSHPWDHAPGAFLISAQGGVAKRFDLADYNPFDDRKGMLVSRESSIVKYSEKFAP